MQCVITLATSTWVLTRVVRPDDLLTQVASGTSQASPTTVAYIIHALSTRMIDPTDFITALRSSEASLLAHHISSYLIEAVLRSLMLDLTLVICSFSLRC